MGDDELGFEDVYEMYFEFVFRCVRALGVPPAAAEDATQEVFVVVHRRWGEFEAGASMRAWLYGIARNMAARHHRRARRAQTELLPAAPPTPEERFDRTEAAAFVERFLETLPVSQREVFVLAQLEEMTAPEIVQALGINLNTVYSRLRTARQKFHRFASRRLEVGGRRRGR